MTAQERAALRDKVAREQLGLVESQPRAKNGTFEHLPPVPERPGREPKYPVLGIKSIIECPVHLLVVALDDSGRICSRCPRCRAEAEQALRLVAA